MSDFIFILFFSFSYILSSFHAFQIQTGPDLAAVQTQTLRRPPPEVTIPAFPEQSYVFSCPLNLPGDLFHSVKSACVSHSFSSDHRSRCCPVLAVWLYSGYSTTALRISAAEAKTHQPAAPYEMPVLPDDSETCVDTLERALGNRGIQLRRPNATCDVVYCYCGIRLHPFSCPEAFKVNSDGELEAGESVRKLETACSGGGGVAACSKCLHGLFSLNEEKSRRANNRTSKIHNRDCELMGLTWLLNKNRSAYIHTATSVLRQIMNENEASNVCSLSSDGMPLAVDSSEINGEALPSSRLLRYYILQMISLFCFCAFVLSFSDVFVVNN